MVCLNSGFKYENNYIIDWLSTVPHLKLFPLNIPNTTTFKRIAIIRIIIMRKYTYTKGTAIGYIFGLVGGNMINYSDGKK